MHASRGYDAPQSMNLEQILKTIEQASALYYRLVADWESNIHSDFAGPGGVNNHFRPEEVLENTPLLTDYIRDIHRMMHSRPNGSKELGIRVYPTVRRARRKCPCMQGSSPGCATSQSAPAPGSAPMLRP